MQNNDQLNINEDKASKKEFIDHSMFTVKVTPVEFISPSIPIEKMIRKKNSDSISFCSDYSTKNQNKLEVDEDKAIENNSTQSTSKKNTEKTINIDSKYLFFKK